MQSSPNPKRSRGRALLALSLLVPAPSLGVLFAMDWWQGPAGQTLYAVSKAWLLGLPAVWWLAVERGSPSWSPPRRGGMRVGLLWGGLIGFVVLAAFLSVWNLRPDWIPIEPFRDKATENGIGTPARYLGVAVYLCTINAVLEEYVWRWFVVRQCEAWLSGPLAVVASALLFTVHHVIALAYQFPPLVTALASVGVFAGGVIWSGLYVRYRSIWPGCVSHIVVDVVIFAIGWRLLF